MNDSELKYEFPRKVVMFPAADFPGEERILAQGLEWIDAQSWGGPKVFGRSREDTAMSQKHLSLEKKRKRMAGKISTK